MDERQWKHRSLAALQAAVAGYCPISAQTWAALVAICTPMVVRKGAFFTRAGEVPHSFGFVYSGLLRAYITDARGNEYNKNFFAERDFLGSMVALLTTVASRFSIEALEPSQVVQIDFAAYRRLLAARHDLKWFQILYLEKNWVIAKEPREVALVQDTATERYLRFKDTYPALEKRVPLYHIASHLGITPTQLSRIRKTLAQQGPTS